MTDLPLQHPAHHGMPVSSCVECVLPCCAAVWNEVLELALPSQQGMLVLGIVNDALGMGLAK